MCSNAEEALDDLFINLLKKEDSPFVPVADFRAKERLLAV